MLYRLAVTGLVDEGDRLELIEALHKEANSPKSHTPFKAHVRSTWTKDNLGAKSMVELVNLEKHVTTTYKSPLRMPLYTVPLETKEGENQDWPCKTFSDYIFPADKVNELAARAVRCLPRGCSPFL